MTYVSVDRDKTTETKRKSMLTAGNFTVRIEWVAFDNKDEEIEKILVSKSGENYWTKSPRDIETLRDLLSAALVELGIEEVQDDTVRE